MEFKLHQYRNKNYLTCCIDLLPSGIKLKYLVPEKQNLVWPTYSGMSRTDKLWLSTCFELFLGAEGQSGYTELNVAPSGAWNCYHFDNYREGMRESKSWELQRVEERNGYFSATFSGNLPPSHIRIGPSVILQLKSSELNYFAISHADQPDFHDPDRHVFVSTNDL